MTISPVDPVATQCRQGRLCVPCRKLWRQPEDRALPTMLVLIQVYLAWHNAAGLTYAPHPADRRAHLQLELPRRLAARHAAALNRRNHPLEKINRVISAPSMLASGPAIPLSTNDGRAAGF